MGTRGCRTSTSSCGGCDRFGVFFSFGLLVAESPFTDEAMPRGTRMRSPGFWTVAVLELSEDSLAGKSSTLVFLLLVSDLAEDPFMSSTPLFTCMAGGSFS